MTAVAIDGPAGAGKTTVARGLAAELGWEYVDTGAMYRAVAALALERGADLSDAAAVAVIAKDAMTTATKGSVVPESRLRKPEVSRAASLVATHPQVRSVLVEAQRDAARAANVVMEGRDIGSVVLPDALVKVFLTASLTERSARRARDLGVEPDDTAELEDELAARDEADRRRSVSPLLTPADAVVVDSTGKTAAEVVAEIAALVGERMERQGKGRS